MTAHGILKREMQSLGSIVLTIAGKTCVPAGKALAVDRTAFASQITEYITAQPLITLRREEVKTIEIDCPTIIATGPLTSDALARDLACLTDSSRLFFYDAISPIIEAESIDMGHAFFGARWSDDNPDYLNCPLDEDQYRLFMEELLKADKVGSHEFEDARFFEACLPIEVLASRGTDALRFGPMRPVGLKDPSTLKRPYAVVQLRKENLPGNAYTMVGFQTRLTYPEQKRIIGLIPALSSARYLRYGSIHRNTYLDSPRVLGSRLKTVGPIKHLSRRPDHGGRGIYGISSHGYPGRHLPARKNQGQAIPPPGYRDGHGGTDALYNRLPNKGLPTYEHQFRYHGHT